MSTIVRPIGLSDRPGLSEDRLAAEASYAANLAAWSDADKAAAELRRSTTADPETASFTELCSRRDAYRDAELIVAQMAIGVCREFVAHVEARQVELQAAKAEADAGLAKTEAGVVKKLASVGVTPQSQPAYRSNPSAAQVTFNQQVRGSADWVHAKAVANSATEAVSATLAELRNGKARLAQAFAYLESIVAQVAGVSVTTPGPRLAGLVA